jgi:hypothetical protein
VAAVERAQAAGSAAAVSTMARPGRRPAFVSFIAGLPDFA